MSNENNKSRRPSGAGKRESSATGRGPSKSSSRSSGKAPFEKKSFGSKRSPKTYGDKPYSPRNDEAGDRKSKSGYAESKEGSFKKTGFKKDFSKGESGAKDFTKKDFGKKDYTKKDFGNKDYQKKDFTKKEGTYSDKKKFDGKGGSSSRTFGSKPYSPRGEEGRERRPKPSYGENINGVIRKTTYKKEFIKKEYPRKDDSYSDNPAFEGEENQKPVGDKPYTPRTEGSYERKSKSSYDNYRQGGLKKSSAKDFPRKDDADKDGAKKDFTKRDSTKKDSPKRDYVKKDYVKKDFPIKEGGYADKKPYEGKSAAPRYGDKAKGKSSANPDQILPEDEWYALNEKELKPDKPARKKLSIPEVQDGQLRLNRFISNSGICSRRDADELIAQGLISVNGEVVTELGLKVSPLDSVKYEGKLLRPERMAYVLLNKPKDFITTMDDPEDRRTVMDLIKNACKERVYPVGRLDRNTTGLLLLTNDGELAEKLTHPSHQISKIYQVDLDKPITEADMDKIQAGVYLEDGLLNVIDIAIVSPDKKILGVEISEGRNRVIRRLFETLGYDVVRLDRVSYAGLTKKDLPRGNYRLLSEKEVAKLKYSSKK